jgi:hypothetical protein
MNVVEHDLEKIKELFEAETLVVHEESPMTKVALGKELAKHEQ